MLLSGVCPHACLTQGKENMALEATLTLSPQSLNPPESLSPKEVSSRISLAWEVSLQHLRLNKLVSCPGSSLSVPLCQEHCRGHGYKLL